MCACSCTTHDHHTQRSRRAQHVQVVAVHGTAVDDVVRAIVVRVACAAVAGHGGARCAGTPSRPGCCRGARCTCVAGDCRTAAPAMRAGAWMCACAHPLRGCCQARRGRRATCVCVRRCVLADCPVRPCQTYVRRHPRYADAVRARVVFVWRATAARGCVTWSRQSCAAPAWAHLSMHREDPSS